MSRDFQNQAERCQNSGFYYSFPYESTAEMNAHYVQPHQPYFNGCPGYMGRTSQQSLPVRIDMNMTAYVQRPPQLSHYESYEAAQLPIAQNPNATSTFLLDHHRPNTKVDFLNTSQFDVDKSHELQSASHRVYLPQGKFDPPSPMMYQRDATAVSIQNLQLKSDVIHSPKGVEWPQRTNHANANKNTGKFQCFLCGKKYCRQSTLKAHLRQHSGEKPYVCNICGKNFSQSANLNAHKRVHTGEKPFSCTICCRPFSQSSSLMTHKRTHSGERPYQCSTCDKAFSDSSTLTKHVRTHTGLKPYSCRICHFSFSQSGNLNRHMKTHLKNQDNQQM